MSITVPAVALMQSVEELPAPIGRNGGRYGEPGTRHSRSSFKVRGRITDGGIGARRLKRLVSRSFSLADMPKLPGRMESALGLGHGACGTRHRRDGKARPRMADAPSTGSAGDEIASATPLS
jgi:hypothetical protein